MRKMRRRATLNVPGHGTGVSVSAHGEEGGYSDADAGTSDERGRGHVAGREGEKAGAVEQEGPDEGEYWTGAEEPDGETEQVHEPRDE